MTKLMCAGMIMATSGIFVYSTWSRRVSVGVVVSIWDQGLNESCVRTAMFQAKVMNLFQQAAWNRRPLIFCLTQSTKCVKLLIYISNPTRKEALNV